VVDFLYFATIASMEYEKFYRLAMVKANFFHTLLEVVMATSTQASEESA